jgi:hypothetical protein
MGGVLHRTVIDLAALDSDSESTSVEVIKEAGKGNFLEHKKCRSISQYLSILIL